MPRQKRFIVVAKKFLQGFTLIEVMIIVAIVAILFVSLMVTMRFQRLKAQDAQIKEDLHLLKVAFENYYSDNNCYPPPEWFDNKSDCGADYLNPYLESLPCSPVDGTPYYIEKDISGCGWFKLYANLNNAEDPEAKKLWVETDGNEDYNYGVSSTNTQIEIDNPNTSGPESGPYYCRGWGNCVGPFANPPCGVTWSSPNCSDSCYNWSNICP